MVKHYLLSNFFSIEIDGILEGNFKSCSGLEMATNIHEYEQGGRRDTEKHISTNRHSDLILYGGIIEGNQLFHLLESKKRINGSIILFDNTFKELKRYNFYRGFVFHLKVNPFGYDEHGALLEFVKITYEKLELQCDRPESMPVPKRKFSSEEIDEIIKSSQGIFCNSYILNTVEDT